MSSIRILNLKGKKVMLSDRQSVLSGLQEQFVDWMHACGGKGRCTTCAFTVCSGMDQLSEPTHVERRFREEGRLGADQRLACQTRCLGEAEIEVPVSNQLPHVSYQYE